MSELIDRQTGAVRLEKGLILNPGQSPDELIRLVGSTPSGSFGKMRWFSDIRMDTDYGHMTMGLVFKGEHLNIFQASFSSGYGPPAAIMKRKHDQILTDMLGRPTSEGPISRSFFEKLFFRSSAQSWHKGAKEFTWKFPWGTVISTVEPREGAAQFRVKWK